VLLNLIRLAVLALSPLGLAGLPSSAQPDHFPQSSKHPAASTISVTTPPARPDPSSRRTFWAITEIHFHPPAFGAERNLAFVELQNTSLIQESLEGYRLTGSFPFAFSPLTSVPPGGRIVVGPDPAALAARHSISYVVGGFSPNSIEPSQGSVRLLNPAGAVLLEVDYRSVAPWPTETLQGRSLVLTQPSYGERDPRAWSASATLGGSPGHPEPDSPRPTPSPAPPAFPAAEAPPVVLHEILYHPIHDDSDLEFVELYNRSQETIDLSGWRFVDGIAFEFPAGARIQPQGYAVVARNASRLLASYPQLPRAIVWGNFRGQLANSGERIALARPSNRLPSPAGPAETAEMLVDEVTYQDGGSWGLWSDGGGSSLELVDPDADNDHPSNWADSDESAKAPWTTLETTGPLVGGVGAINQLQILSLGAGSYLIDDVEVLTADGQNTMRNGTFELGVADWTPSGTHAGMSWASSLGTSHSAGLRIEASGRGDTGANQIQTPLLPGLVHGQTATLRARIRWLRGHHEVLARLRGNHLEALGTLAVTPNPGTPGAANSRAVSNAGPILFDITQVPLLPAAGEAVQVTARITDPDGILNAQLRYRIDPGTEWTQIPMVPDVTDPARYLAQLPGQPAGTLVAFDIMATDAAPVPATRRYPMREPHHEALVRFGEHQPPGPLGTYRLWMTQATFDAWARRSPLDNHPLPLTFVYNDERVVHGVGGRYAGSPHLAPTYNTPAGNPCGYVLHFPKDEPFLGATEVVLDWPGRDTTAQQEPFAYWIARELGIPFNHRRFIRLHVNGVTESQRGTIYEDAQQVNGDLVESWLPDQTDGALHKIEQWFEFSDSLATASVVAPRLENFTLPDGRKNTSRYRWNWLPRAVQESANDFSRLFELVDAANDPDLAAYRAGLAAQVDMEQWMRVFAVENIVVNFDAWGYDIGKNMYAYAPPRGPWRLFLWDIDWVMTTSAQYGYSPTSTLMYRGPARFSAANRDPVVGRMYDEPVFQRAYWRAIADAVEGPLLPERASPRMEGLHAALVAAGVTHSAGALLTPPTEVLGWLRARRNYLIEQLAEVSPPFSFAPIPEVTALSKLTLEGIAPIQGRDLTINGIPAAVTWITPIHWSTALPLAPGSNDFRIAWLDGRGLPPPGSSARNLRIRRAALRLLGIEVAPDGWLVVRAVSEPLTRWQLESAPSLVSDAWTRIASGVTGADGMIEATDPLPIPSNTRFYRAAILP
jgi:hypothetical protein